METNQTGNNPLNTIVGLTPEELAADDWASTWYDAWFTEVSGTTAEEEAFRSTEQG